MGPAPPPPQEPRSGPQPQEARTFSGPPFGATVLHLFSLNSLAIVQPLLDRLKHNSAYLSQEQIGPTALIAVVLIFLTAIPMFLTVTLGISHRISDRLYRRTRAVSIALMVGLLALSLLASISRHFDLMTLGVPGFLWPLLAVAAGLLAARNYTRRPVVANAMTFLGLGIIAVPATFFLAAPVREIVWPSAPEIAPDRPHADNPIPVVMVVFDGLSGMALLGEDHQIDAIRYPSFARLAGQSTWYRNASAVHPRTDNAVPAILSGNYPTSERQPTEAEYPENLLALLHQSGQYEMSVFEPYTRLCPEELEPKPPERSIVEQTTITLDTLLRVYAVTTFPQDIPLWRTRIPREWFGLRDTFRINRADRVGLFRYSWDVDRRIQVDHFRDCLLASEKPAFRFLHVVAPHYPWKYLPSGRTYARGVDALDFPVGAFGLHGEDWTSDPLPVHYAWQRYLLQLQAVDRWLGKILDDLESRGLIDECLLVITADHGVAFQPGVSRRDPVPQNLPDILPVPLFIKLPGQKTGSVTDRNVESVDILPTIAEILKLQLPNDMEGWSVLDETEAPKPRKTLMGGAVPIVVQGDFPERFRYTAQMLERFGSGTDDRLFSLDTIPELVGCRRNALTIGEPSGLQIKLEWAAPSLDSSAPEFVPCLFSGSAIGRRKDTPPTHLAVLINGMVAATTRTYEDSRIHTRFAAMIPESVFAEAYDSVSICEVRRAGEEFTLHECLCQFPSALPAALVSGDQETEQ